MRSVVLLLAVFPVLVFGQTSKEVLAEALFEEEANGDLKGAAEKYESLVKGYENERKIAAIALYRLAGIEKKKGDDKKEAELYRRLITEFAGVEPQERLARRELEAMGLKLPVEGDVVAKVDEEEAELARLKKLAVTSPDVRVRKNDIGKAIDQNWLRVISFLLESHDKESLKEGFMIAVEEGNLGIVKQFLDAGFDPNQEGVLEEAISNRYEKIVQLLMDRGGNLKSVGPNLLILRKSMASKQVPTVKFALELGLDPNKRDPSAREDPLGWDADRFGLPLLQAVNVGSMDCVELLLKHGADPNLVEHENDVSALHLAVRSGKIEIAQSLIKAGAKIDYKTTTPVYRGRPPGASSVPISVVQLAKPGSEAFFLLLENGATFPKGILQESAEVGSKESVDALLKQGVDINETSNGNESDTPLLRALRARHFELADYLRAKGATLHPDHWTYVWGELAVKWNRELHYPALVEGGKVTFLFPEAPVGEGVIASLEAGADLYQRLLDQGVWSVMRTNGHSGVHIRYDRLKWSLLRNGKSTVLNLERDGFPMFKKGDIVEITGLFETWENERLFFTDKMKLGALVPAELAAKFREKNRMPLVVVVEGEEYAMELRGDVAAYDPRTNRMPLYSTLKELMQGLGRSFRWFPSMKTEVRLVREGAPTVAYSLDPFGSNQNIPYVPLAPGDRLEFATVVDQNVDRNEVVRKARAEWVEVSVPGSPCLWEWPAGEPVMIPTLLQALAEVNRGCRLDRDLQAQVKEDVSVLEGLSSVQLYRSALARGTKPSVAPAIDWSKIEIHRLVEGKEDQVIAVNLQDKMQEWDQGGRQGDPFDLELQKGDQVKLVLRKEAWGKPMDLVDTYFKKGLAIPVTLKVLDSKGVPGPLMTGNLEYEAPRWIESMGSVVPLYLDTTRGEIDEMLDGLITVQVTREGGSAEGVRISRNDYFPRAGDQIWSERRWGPITQPMRPSKPEKSRPRARYVPRPPE